MKSKTTRLSQSRRKFIKAGAAAGALLSAVPFSHILAGENLTQGRSLSMRNVKHPLKILILGGTSFLGPHQIAYAINRGHSITIFTRGRTKPTIHTQLFKDVEHLVGDRKDNLVALGGRQWDAVIDNSGNNHEWTRDSATLLRDNVGLYLYVSSTGVYYPYLGSNIKEETKRVMEVPDGINEIQKMEYGFGVMKSKSEDEAQRVFKDRTIIVRPTYMMGPADRTDRFTYWPIRLSRGGEVMVPGKNNDPVQFIDVRDAAGYMIRLIENKTTGISNAVGPASAMGMQAFVHGVHAAFGTPVSFTSIPDYSFLEKEHGIMDLIPWIAPVGENAGSALINNERGIANGLTFTPLAKSSVDIYNWWISDAVEESRRLKMVSGESSIMKKEKEILASWAQFKKE